LPTGTGAQKENFDVQPGNCNGYKNCITIRLEE